MTGVSSTSGEGAAIVLGSTPGKILLSFLRPKLVDGCGGSPKSETHKGHPRVDALPDIDARPQFPNEGDPSL